MKILTLTMSLVLLVACAPSQEEKEKIAAVTCAVMSETRNMDAAVRVEKINAAREEIGAEPFLSGDDAIKEAFEYGVCQALVLNDEYYDATLQVLKDTKAEQERIAAEKQAEEERIAVEKRAEEERRRETHPWIEEEFWASGILKERTHYQSKNDGGEMHGLYQKWYETGQLMSEGNYKNGKRHGLSKGWHENGQLSVEANFKNGEEHGFIRMWDENGQLELEANYKNGEIQ